MSEINLIKLISSLINHYEFVHGRTRFEVQKVGNTFICTKVNQKMLDTLKLKRLDVLGKKCSDLPIGIDLAERDPSIYEKAWAGKEMLQILFPSTNENVCLLVVIRPVVKNGKTVKLIGCCAPLDSKDLKDRYLSAF